MENSNPNRKDGNERLTGRENSLFRLAEVTDRKTHQDVKNQRKQEMETKYQAYYKKKVIEESKFYL